MGDFLGSFEGICCFSYLFVFNESEFGENLNFFNDAIVGHQLSHGSFIVMLRNASQPKLPNQNITRLLPHHLFRASWGVIHRYVVVLDRLVALIGRSGHGWIVLVGHVGPLVLHWLVWVTFIHGHSFAI